MSKTRTAEEQVRAMRDVELVSMAIASARELHRRAADALRDRSEVWPDVRTRHVEINAASLDARIRSVRDSSRALWLACRPVAVTAGIGPDRAEYVPPDVAARAARKAREGK